MPKITDRFPIPDLPDGWLTPFQKALHLAPDRMTEAMLSILDQRDLSHLHQVQPHIVLAMNRHHVEPKTNVMSARAHLKAAEAALVVARQFSNLPHTNELVMDPLSKMIREEWQSLALYQREHGVTDEEVQALSDRLTQLLEKEKEKEGQSSPARPAPSIQDDSPCANRH